jgi:hypothetical protein
MRRTLLAMLVGILTLAGALSGRADDAALPAAILDRAIKALGDEAKLNKFQGLMLKGKGVYHDAGSPDVPFTGTWYTQGLDKARTLIQIEAKGGKSQSLTVVNGDRGWNKEGNQEAATMDKDELAEEKENLYFNWVTLLAPLKGKSFKLTPLDEVKVDGRPAVGFTVTQPGRRDIKLYFDKESNLLVKSEREVRDPSSKQKHLEETLFSNYREADGIKIAMKFSVKSDGQPQADAELSEAKLHEKLDEKLFAKP